MSYHPTIEILEDRIAPATLLNPYTVTYQDIDGDSVVVKISKPLFASNTVDSLLTFSTGTVDGSNATPQSLSSINLEGVTQAQGMDISVTVLPRLGVGNAQADVGFIDAGAADTNHFRFINNIDLGVVRIQGSLGHIVVGDGTSTPALKSLTVTNLGIANDVRYSGESSVLGPITKLHTTGDMVGLLHLYGDQFGSIGTLNIDGALKGTAGAGSSGLIYFSGTIGNATIGEITGADGDLSGSIYGEGTALFPTSIGKLHILSGGITGGTGANSGEVFANKIGPVQVDGSVTGLGATDAANSGSIQAGKIGSVSILGSLTGGVGGNSGAILGTTQMGAVKIGGDVAGGGGASSGSIQAGKIGSVSILGSLTGGAGASSGELYSATEIGNVKIGGDLTGGGGASAGSIQATKIGSVSIPGSLTGGGALSAGSVQGSQSLGQVTIGGSLIGGAGEQSGLVFFGGASPVSAVSVGGDLKGGSNAYSGTVYGESFKSIVVNGSIIGGEGAHSGLIFANGSIAEASIGGGVQGGTGTTSGAIVTGGSLGRLSIADDLAGGSSPAGNISQSGFISADHIGSISIGGSLIAGSKGSGTISDSGAIRSGTDIGSITISGDFKGDGTNPAIISAVGFLNQKISATQNLAINKIVIGGDMTRAAILAGYADGTASFGVASNPDAQINSVTINGDLTASNIVAGVATGTSGYFGTDTNAVIPAIYSSDLPRILSKISSVIVKGAIGYSAENNNEAFGIVAQYVASMQVNGAAIPLHASGQNDLATGTAPGIDLGSVSSSTITADHKEFHVLEVL